MPRIEQGNIRIGSRFDDFLEEVGIAAEVAERAVREVIAQLVLEHMDRARPTKTEMAARMYTSRQAFYRLLDPEGEV